MSHFSLRTILLSCRLPSRGSLASACLCLAAAVALFSAESRASAVVGMEAPDFVLRSFDDSNVRLSEFRGAVVVVSFWTAWCGPCQQELPRLDGMQLRYGKAGLVTLGVNLDDDTARARSIVQQLALSFPMLIDAAKEVGRLYDLGAMPTTVFIDREGVIRHVQETYRAQDDGSYLERIRQLLDE